jgi:1,4-dihydroxy-2-naphthoate octaprenyltransferase
MKKWLIAIRPWSFPASAMPAIIAITYIFWQWCNSDQIYQVNWINAIFSLIGAIAFQAAGNVISDYFDFKYHVDRKESFGSSRVLIDGMFTPRALLKYGIGLLAFAVIIGLYLLWQSGIQLLWIGLIGLLGTYFYYALKYRAFGDLLIFVIYGQLIALGTAYTMTCTLSWPVLLISMPTGFLIVNILHANNTRDIYFDRKAGIRTFAMVLGIQGSKMQYMILALGSYVAIALFVIFRLVSPICLSVLLTMPLALKNINCMSQASIEQPEKIKALDGMSAQLVMAFSMCIAISNIIAAFL